MSTLQLCKIRITFQDKIMEGRKRCLTKTVDFQQFLTKANNLDTWMLGILKLVSSDDIGKDDKRDIC